MGIKGLPKLIQDTAGTSAVRTYKFSDFNGWTVSVDASLLLHSTVVAMRSSGKDMKNARGELTSHLHGLFYKVLIFLQNDMVPIFVFDGKAPDIKNKTIARRRLRKDEAQKSLDVLTDSEDEQYIKHFKQTFKPTKENIKEAQLLLDLMGIPYIVAPGEADVICAWLAARCDESTGQRYVKGVCSDDSDMLAFGARYLFKDMLRFMNINKPVKVISLRKTLVKMNLEMGQFIDLCVLLGTDYCDNIKGIGPKGAYKLIKKYGTLENVLDALHKKNGSDTELDTDSDSDGSHETDNDSDDESNIACMFKAREYFRNALKEIDDSDDFVLTDDHLKLRKFQYEELMDFMCVKHNFDVTRVQNGINRLEEYHKKMDVTRENTKKVHKILQPRSENYIFKEAFSDDVDFLSSSDEEMPSKKNISQRAAIQKTTTTRKPNYAEAASASIRRKKEPPKKKLIEYEQESCESDISLSDYSDADDSKDLAA